MDSSVPEGLVIPVPLMTLVMLLLLQTMNE